MNKPRKSSDPKIAGRTTPDLRRRRGNARLQMDPALNEDFISNVSKKNRWVTSGYLRCTVGHGDFSGVKFADFAILSVADKELLRYLTFRSPE